VTASRFGDRRAAFKAIALALVLTPPLSLLGCSTPTAPTPPPSGGHSLLLDYNEFAQSVEPVLMQNGCDAAAGGDCHGGGIQGTLELSPTNAKDTRFDFNQVSLQVNPIERDSSRILTKPLAISAGGVPHTGGKVFAAISDSGYQAIHQWIMHGVLQ